MFGCFQTQGAAESMFHITFRKGFWGLDFGFSQQTGRQAAQFETWRQKGERETGTHKCQKFPPEMVTDISTNGRNSRELHVPIR